MKTFDRYKQNLKQIGNSIYSYNTHVAQIQGNKLHKLKWNARGKTSSPTTSKHINYVANELNLDIVSWKPLSIPEHILDGFAEEELKVFYNSITSQTAWIVHDTEVDELPDDEYQDCFHYIVKRTLEMLLELHKENKATQKKYGS